MLPFVFHFAEPWACISDLDSMTGLTAGAGISSDC